MPEPNVRYVAVFEAGADSAVALAAAATPATAARAMSAIAIRFMRSQGSRALTPELRCLPRFYGSQTKGLTRLTQELASSGRGRVDSHWRYLPSCSPPPAAAGASTKAQLSATEVEQSVKDQLSTEG